MDGFKYVLLGVMIIGLVRFGPQAYHVTDTNICLEILTDTQLFACLFGVKNS